MSKLKSIVQKSETIYYLALLAKFSFNKEFRDMVIGIRENPRQVVIKKKGGLCRGRLLCRIDPVIPYCGFFAVFRRLLTALYFSDNIGAEPYVSFSKDFIYSENEPVNGTDEPFEYYFKPIKPVTENELCNANAVIEFGEKNIKMAEIMNTKDEISYKVSEQYLQEMSSVFSKYIFLNETMDVYVNDGLSRLGILHHSTLGIHCRGTDYNVGSKNHPVIVTAEDYFEIIDEVLERGNYTRIFLATDDANRLSEFIEHYGDKLCYYQDVERTTGNEGVHFSIVNREKHHYQLGAEVIRDVYTMASCDGFIAGMSEVSICARIAKRAQNKKYSDEIIIDKGIVLRGKRFSH